MFSNRKLVDFLIFLVPLGGILFVFRKVFFFDNIFSHSDVIHNYFPYFYSLSKWQSLIEPAILSGFPIFTSVSTTWFFPLNKILFTFFDAFSAFRLLDVAYLLFAYIFTYLYLRKVGMNKEVSVLSGLIYVFSGQVMLWSETIIISSYYTILPLSLYLFEHGLRESVNYKKYIFYTLTGLSFGVGWLSGHVQWLVYIHAFFFAYFIYFAYLENFERNLKYHIKKFFDFIYIILISFFVGFPQIYSLLNFLPITERADGVPMSVVYASAYLPHHLIHYFIPSFQIPHLPISSAFHNYLGILPILIFIFSLFFVRKYFKENRFYRFFILVFMFCFVASLKYSPLTFLIHQFPVFSTFREFVRIMFVGNFAVAICISIFLNYLLENKEIFVVSLKKYLVWLRRLFFYFILPVIFIITTIQLFFLDKISLFLKEYFLNNLFSTRVGGFPVDHYYDLIDRYVTQSLYQLSFFNFQVSTFVVFSFLSYFLIKKIWSLDSKKFMRVSILLVALNFSFVYMNRVTAISRFDYLNPPKTAQFIIEREQDLDSFRIMTPFADIALFNESINCDFDSLGGWVMSHKEFLYQKELIEPNSNIIYGLDSAEGYEPYMPERTSSMIGYLGSRWAVADTPALSGEKISIQDKIEKLKDRINLFRVMNVKYIISPFVINSPELKEVFFETIGSCGSEIRIYEISDFWPRYFLTNNVNSVPKNSTFIYYADVMNKTKTPTVFVEDDVVSKASGEYFESIKYSGSPDNMVFNISVKKPGYMFIGNAWMPDWNVAVDNVKVPVIKANYMYMAVYLNEGNHVVNVYYKQRELSAFIKDNLK